MFLSAGRYAGTLLYLLADLLASWPLSRLAYDVVGNYVVRIDVRIYVAHATRLPRRDATRFPQREPTVQLRTDPELRIRLLFKLLDWFLLAGWYFGGCF